MSSATLELQVLGMYGSEQWHARWSQKPGGFWSRWCPALCAVWDNIL